MHFLPGHLIVRPACAVCGESAWHIELVPPGGLPSHWDGWNPDNRRYFVRYRDPTKWQFLLAGVSGGNNLGDSISAERAAKLLAAFAEPLDYDRVRGADLFDDAGFCRECRVPYCSTHWHVEVGDYGRCPHGHGRSFNPHWYPDDTG
jgi:hypothetical protein